MTDGHAADACEAFASDQVGDGIEPSSRIEDAGRREPVRRPWPASADQSDAQGLTDVYGLQAMIAREMYVACACVVQRRPRRPEDGLTVSLQLPPPWSETPTSERAEAAADGRRVRCGIEFDAVDRRAGRQRRSEPARG